MTDLLSSTKVLVLASFALAAVACSTPEPNEPKSGTSSHLDRSGDIVSDEPAAEDKSSIPDDVGSGTGNGVALNESAPAPSEDDQQVASNRIHCLPTFGTDLGGPLHWVCPHSPLITSSSQFLCDEACN